MEGEELKCSICYTFVDEILQLDCPHPICLVCACKIYTPPNTIKCLLCEKQTKINIEAAQILARLSVRHRKSASNSKSGQIQRNQKQAQQQQQLLQMSAQTVKNQQQQSTPYTSAYNTTTKKRRPNNSQNEENFSVSHIKRVSPTRVPFSPSEATPSATKKINFQSQKMQENSRSLKENREQILQQQQQQQQQQLLLKQREIEQIQQQKQREIEQNQRQQREQREQQLQFDQVLDDRVRDGKYSLSQLEESLHRLNTSRSQKSLSPQQHQQIEQQYYQQQLEENNRGRKSSSSKLGRQAQSRVSPDMNRRTSSPKLARQASYSQHIQRQQEMEGTPFLGIKRSNNNILQDEDIDLPQQQYSDKDYDLIHFQKMNVSQTRNKYLEIIKGEMGEIENDIKKKSLQNLENKSVYSQQMSQTKLSIVKQFQDLKHFIEDKVEQILTSFDQSYTSEFRKFEDVENFYSDQIRLFKEFEENAIKDFVQSEVKSPEASYDHFLQQKVDFQDLVIKLDHFKTQKKSSGYSFPSNELNVKGMQEMADQIGKIREHIMSIQGPMSPSAYDTNVSFRKSTEISQKDQKCTARFMGSNTIQVSPRYNSSIEKISQRSQGSLYQLIKQDKLYSDSKQKEMRLLSRERSFSPSRICKSSVDLINIETLSNNNTSIKNEQLNLKEKVEKDTWYYKKIQEIKSNERKLMNKHVNNTENLKTSAVHQERLNTPSRPTSPSPISDVLHLKSHINSSKKKHKNLVEDLQSFQNYRNTRQKNRERINDGLSPSPNRHEKKFGFGNDESPYKSFQNQQKEGGKFLGGIVGRKLSQQESSTKCQSILGNSSKKKERDSSLKVKLDKVKLSLYSTGPVSLK